MKYDITSDIILSAGDDMAAVHKIIEKMRSQPHGIRYEEAVKVLNHYDYTLVRKRGTSHRIFKNTRGDVFVLKDASPVKISYITEILAMVDGE